MPHRRENEADRAAPGRRCWSPPACSPRLVAVAWPGAADSAPPRVVVLGQTAETPPASCPGKSSTTSRSRPAGSRATSPASRRSPAASPGPTRRPSTARSSPGRSPWPSPRRRKRPPPPTRSASSTNSSASPRRPGSASCARSKTPSRRKYTLVRQSPLEVLNPYFGSTPIFALEHPLTVLTGPGRRPDDPHLGADVRLQRRSATTPGAAAACPNTAPPRKTSRAATPSRASARPRPTAATTRNARLLYTATLVKQPHAAPGQRAGTRRAGA